MNALSLPLKCECGTEITPDLEKCPKCGLRNPHFTEPAEVALIEKGFDDLLEELATAHASRCKVIANVGFSESGKSWFIARMARLRDGTARTTLYSTKRPLREFLVQSGQELPRTPAHESYIWHLQETKHTRTRSGHWRVVDIAGETVANLEDLSSGSRFHDVLWMTLAHASAMVLMVDGRGLSDALRYPSSEPGGPCFRSDERHALLIGELVKRVRYVNHWCRRAGAPPRNRDEFATMRAWLDANHRKDLEGTHEPLKIPTLILVSKSDALMRLPKGGAALFDPPGPDPTRFAEKWLPHTHKAAQDNFGLFRWGFIAPFVGQPEKQPVKPDPSEIIHFGRPSYGVADALRWLDDELRSRLVVDPLLTRHALDRVWRWRPHLPARKRGA